MTYYFRLPYSGDKKTIKILMFFNTENWLWSPSQKREKWVWQYLFLGKNSNESTKKRFFSVDFQKKYVWNLDWTICFWKGPTLFLEMLLLNQKTIQSLFDPTVQKLIENESREEKIENVFMTLPKNAQILFIHYWTH